MSGTPDTWSAEQQHLFNRLYRHMVESKRMFVHPDAPVIPDEFWQTTAWNAAWIAAVMIDPGIDLIAQIGPDGDVEYESPMDARTH